MSVRGCVAVVTLLVAAVMAGGCASERARQQGVALLDEGNVEAGIARLEEAVKADPKNPKARADLAVGRAQGIVQLTSQADAARSAGNLDQAEAIYRRVQRIEPTSERAVTGLAAIVQERASKTTVDTARAALERDDIEASVEAIRQLAAQSPGHRQLPALVRQLWDKHSKRRVEIPTLSALYRKPVSLDFRDGNLQMIFELLSKTTGINFLLDRDIRPDLKTSVFVRQAPLEEAVDLLLVTNQLKKKVLSANSVLIYPNTPAKQQEYQDLVIKSFYLVNSDGKQVAETLKTLLKAKDVVLDERLNLIVMRDRPEAIRLAERIVAMHDLSEPEVMLELEVLEVKRSKLQELGVQFPQQIGLTVLPSSGSVLTLDDLSNLSSSQVAVDLPSTLINLKKEVGDVSILANPRIRAKNREKAKVLIGDRVPVITTTATSTGFVSESISYLDVGLKLDVEPNIYLKDEVAILISLEVSNIVREIRSGSGTLAYQLGTRNASTLLRLRDGETQVLAGLISDEDRRTSTRVPGLGDLPIVGRLFASQKDEKQKTEIVLMVTPRLLRTLARPLGVAPEFWSGTEADLRTSPLMLGGEMAIDLAALPALPPNGEAGTVAASAQDSASTPPRAPPAPVGVEVGMSGPETAKVGTPITIAVRAKADGALKGLPLQIGFDPSVFDIGPVTEGEFFKRSGSSSFSQTLDVTTGRIFVGASSVGDTSATGEETVAHLVLIPKKSVAASEVRILSATPQALEGASVTVDTGQGLTIKIDP